MSTSFILCLYMKNIRHKLAKVHLVYFVQRAQHEITAKHLTQSSILMRRLSCSGRRSILNPQITGMAVDRLSQKGALETRMGPKKLTAHALSPVFFHFNTQLLHFTIISCSPNSTYNTPRRQQCPVSIIDEINIQNR